MFMNCLFRVQYFSRNLFLILMYIIEIPVRDFVWHKEKFEKRLNFSDNFVCFLHACILSVQVIVQMIN